MLTLTIYRGSHEIGGSCVEVKTNSSRLIIDIGMPLVNRDGTKFKPANNTSSVNELIEAQVLPRVSGLFNSNSPEPPVDGLLISHPHLDHYGLFSYVRDDVKFYLGKAAKSIIDLTVLFTPAEGNIKNFYLFQSGIPFRCGEFKVTPYLMDHSAFDAYAFVIEADGKTIIYSGDFRAHGRKEKAFDYFLAKAPRNADAILLEGSMFGRDNGIVKTESDIEDEIVQLIREKGQAVLAYFSAQNIDRLVSFYRAAIKTGRILLVDVYTANVLETLNQFAPRIPCPSSAFPNLRVYYPKFLCDRMARDGLKHLMYKFRSYKITKPEISRNVNKMIMMVRTSMLWDLERIAGLENATFIYSMWEGYLKDESIQPLLDFTKNKGMEFRSIHTSGHANIKTLKQAVDTLKPQKVIPIHTFFPGQYNVLRSNICQIYDGEEYLV